MYIDSLIVLAVVLHPYYLEVFLSGGVVCIVVMVMDRGGFLKVFFESFSKGARCLPYVFLITCKVPTFEPVDGPLLFSMGPLSLGESRSF